MADRQPFRWELVNCHSEPDIFYVQPEGHKCQPYECVDGSVMKCSTGAGGLTSVSNRDVLKPRFEAMQEILRRSNAHDDLAGITADVAERHPAVLAWLSDAPGSGVRHECFYCGVLCNPDVSVNEIDVSEHNPDCLWRRARAAWLILLDEEGRYQERIGGDALD